MAFTQTCEPRSSGTHHLSFVATLFGAELLRRPLTISLLTWQSNCMVEASDSELVQLVVDALAGGLPQIPLSRTLSLWKFALMLMTNCSTYFMAGISLFANSLNRRQGYLEPKQWIVQLKQR